MDSVRYAKNYKKNFLNEVLENKQKSKDNKQAIFMAGSSGSGKSEVANNILTFQPKFCCIDADAFRTKFPGYNGKNSAKYQSGSSYLVDYIFSWCIQHSYSFLLDATFASPKARLNVKRTLDHGYSVKVEYLYQNSLDAWNFIKERVAITGRAVPKKVFISSFLASMENVITVKRDFGDSIIVNVRVQDFVLNTKKVYNNAITIKDKVPKFFMKIELEELLIDD